MPKKQSKRAKAEYPAWLDKNMTAKQKRLVEDATARYFVITGTTAKLEKKTTGRTFTDLLPHL